MAPTIIGGYVREAEKSSECGFLQLYSCRLEGSECPILKRGQCIHVGMWSRCVYGEGSRERTCARRGKGYHAQIVALKKRAGSLPKMPDWERDTGFVAIGDYYFVPYAHASMCERIKFVQHSGFGSFGVPFVKREEFGPEQVVVLFKFRPQAMMGGEITDYQKGVPVFLYHLRARFPDLYEAAAALCPEIRGRTLDVESITSLRCHLANIPVGRTDGFKVKSLGAWLDVIVHEENSITVYGKPSDLGIGLRFMANGDDARLTFCPDRARTEVLVTALDLIRQIVLVDPSVAKAA
jgi:hypothetical protein